jgi:predicted ATPase
MIHLRSIQPRALPARPDYPFSLQLIQNFKGISFDSPVTLLVGENGSGKSTILEALACAADMIIVGSESSRNDKSLVHARELAKYFKLIWTKRIRRGFFLRAEDFFGYAKRLNQMRTEMESDLQEIDSEFKDRSDYARELARMSTAHELGALQQRYGEGLDAHSHGESFLSLFQSRFVPDGLYLLDEPEAPLSPIRQLALIATIKDMVAQNGQFIIATHSPILMAYPEATLLNFTEGKILPAHYDELEHIRLMRDFLNDPQAFVRNL